MSAGEAPNGEASAVLVDRFRQGDRAAIWTLLERHHETVRRIVRVKTGKQLFDRHEFDGMLHEVLIEACDSATGYHPRAEARFIDWLATLVVNKIRKLGREATNERPPGGLMSLDRLLGDASGSSLPIDVAAETTALADKIGRAEFCAIVDDCLREEANVAHRDIILARMYAGDEDWASLAERFGCPNAHAAEQLYQRAFKKLRARVELRIEALRKRDGSVRP